MNACGDKSIIMNRRVLCSWFLYQQWYRYLPAGKNTMYRNPLILGVPIFFVKRFQSCYYNGHPALLLRGPYRGTTATTIRTSTYTGIHSFQYGTHTEGLLRPLYEQVHTQVFIHSNTVPILDVLLPLCFPPTHVIVPKLCRPI